MGPSPFSHLRENALSQPQHRNHAHILTSFTSAIVL